MTKRYTLCRGFWYKNLVKSLKRPRLDGLEVGQYKWLFTVKVERFLKFPSKREAGHFTECQAKSGFQKDGVTH